MLSHPCYRANHCLPGTHKVGSAAGKVDFVESEGYRIHPIQITTRQLIGFQVN